MVVSEVGFLYLAHPGWNLTQIVYNMGLDLATLLAKIGAVQAGDLVSWSIGGPPPSSLLGSLGLLGSPKGITGSHAKYEVDTSPTRGDLYQLYVICPGFDNGSS